MSGERDDEELTPVDTPSAMLRLGLVDCPLCARTGKLSTGDDCWYCKGGRVVSKERAEEWAKAHPPPPEPPSSGLPDYSTLEDTDPAPSEKT